MARPSPKRAPHRGLVVSALALSAVAGLVTGFVLPAGNAADGSASQQQVSAPTTKATAKPKPKPKPTSAAQTTADPEAPAGSDTPVDASAGSSAKASASPSYDMNGPIPATPVKQARNIPDYPLDGGTGRRIVYDKALMTVWLVDANDTVVKRYPVVGRWDRPLKGTYEIYSKSPSSWNPVSELTFNHMVRFAWGTRDKTAAIGFHSIPRDLDGKPVHSEAQLGLPIAAGGCVRLADEDARFLYQWAQVGDTVVVLPSPDWQPTD